MAFYVTGADGNKVDLKAGSNPPRVRNPFELGFHQAVLGNALQDNPFPPHTTATEEWDTAWKVFKARKQKYDWMLTMQGQLPPEALDGPKLTFLCLVKDREGFFLHQPCDPKYKGFSLDLIWLDYQGRLVADVIEFAVVPMKNPRFVNAMQANPNWKPQDCDDSTAT